MKPYYSLIESFEEGARRRSSRISMNGSWPSLNRHYGTSGAGEGKQFCDVKLRDF